MGGFLGRGLYIGELFGVNIRVHWSLLAILAFGATSALVALAFMILFLTVLLHELGHCFAARSVGGEAREILLWPLGGLAFTSGTQKDAGSFIWVAFAGPMMHIPLALLFGGVLAWLGHPPSLSDLNPLAPENYPKTALLDNVIYFAFRLQVMLFCLNMLPAYPLDGGQILVGWLSARLDLPRTARLCAYLSLACAFGMVLLGQLPDQDGLFVIGFLLGFEGVRLLMAVQSGSIDYHAMARLYARAQVITPETPRPMVAEEYLRPCPHCQKPIHLKAERCNFCDRLVD